MDRKVLFAELSLLMVTIVWGLGFPITKVAINLGYGPNTIMVGRFLTASIILGLVYWKQLKTINKQIIIYGSITGLFLFFGFYFQTVGNVYTTASKNGFITQLNIVFVPYLYYLFFKRKVDAFNIISVVVATLGLFILTYNKQDFIGLNIGDFYTLLCAVMVAFHVTTGSYFQKKYDFNPAIFVFINISVAAVLSVFSMAFTETMPQVGIVDLWPLVFLGVFNTALGFLVQSYTLKISIPTRVSLIVTLESVFSAIGSVLILHEIVTVPFVLGGLFIISAVLLSEVKPFKRKVIRPL